ncbi:MAG: hypothetical protein AB1503_12955 [Bacillota bacterium]
MIRIPAARMTGRASSTSGFKRCADLRSVVPENGIFTTTDGGGSGKATSVGLPRVAVKSLLVDPTNPLNLYAGTDGLGALKSTDGGSSWSMASRGLTDLKVGTLAVDPHNPKTLYTGTQGGWTGGVFKSTDAGGSWTLVGLANIAVFSLAVDPHQPQTVYAATSDRGVFKTTDGGASWKPMNNGLQDLYVYALAVVPQDPRTLYAGTRNGGIFKSADGAASWTQVNKGLTDFTCGTWLWTLATPRPCMQPRYMEACSSPPTEAARGQRPIAGLPRQLQAGREPAEPGSSVRWEMGQGGLRVHQRGFLLGTDR